MLYHNWSMAYIHLGEIKKALSICNKVDQKNKESYFMLDYVKAFAYLELGEKDKALQAINLCIDGSEEAHINQYNSIKDYCAPFLKGKILSSLNRYEEAIKLFTETLNRKPNTYPAIFLRGVAYLHINQLLKALEDFLKIEKNIIYKEDVMPLIAQCYFNMGQPKEAIRKLKDISKDFILPQELLINWFAHGQEDRDSTEIQYRFNQQNNPSEELMINYGRALIQFDLYPSAEEQFKKVLLKNELNVNAWFNLGDLYLKREDYRGSKKCYEKALSLEKENIDGWLNLGNCYFALGDSLKAIDCYEEVLTRSPNHHAAFQNLKIIVSDLQAS